MIFWGLKFDIFSIPNFLATFYVLGSPVQNDLNAASTINWFVQQIFTLSLANLQICWTENQGVNLSHMSICWNILPENLSNNTNVNLSNSFILLM